MLGAQAAALSGVKLPEIPPLVLVLFVVFFLLGYFLYGALYAAVGASVNSQQEAQSLAFPVLMPLILARDVLPDGAVEPRQHALTRLVAGALLDAAADVPARLGAHAARLADRAVDRPDAGRDHRGFNWVAARIYRVGILMYGKRPTFPEILKWIRKP